MTSSLVVVRLIAKVEDCPHAEPDEELDDVPEKLPEVPKLVVDPLKAPLDEPVNAALDNVSIEDNFVF